MKRLSRSLLNYISDYLCFVDTLAFRISLPKSNIKKKDFNEIIRKRLNELKIDADRLLKMLNKYNCGLSGSFILQCLYNEYWNVNERDYEFIGSNLIDRYEKEKKIKSKYRMVKNKKKEFRNNDIDIYQIGQYKTNKKDDKYNEDFRPYYRSDFLKDF